MNYRQLGGSGLRVSALSLGTMTFDDASRSDARRQIDMALDAGVNLIDTANVYSAGAAEEVVGEALGARRDQVLLATKVRFAMGPAPNDAGLSRYHVIAACEASLRRLRTDHIDLYQVHQWDGQTPVDETLEALDTLIRSGKVRYVGCSNFSGWHVMKSLAASARRGFERYASMQIHYTLQSREAEYELVPIAIDQGLGVLVWSPLAGGLLSGKYLRGQSPSSGRHANGWREPPVRDTDHLYDLVDALIEIGAAQGYRPAAVALAWLLQRPGISSVILGARTHEQLATNLSALELRLDEAQLTRLDRLSAPPLLYPYWHQAANAPERLSAADVALLGPHLAAE